MSGKPCVRACSAWKSTGGARQSTLVLLSRRTCCVPRRADETAAGHLAQRTRLVKFARASATLGRATQEVSVLPGLPKMFNLEPASEQSRSALGLQRYRMNSCDSELDTRIASSGFQVQ